MFGHVTLVDLHYPIFRIKEPHKWLKRMVVWDIEIMYFKFNNDKSARSIWDTNWFLTYKTILESLSNSIGSLLADTVRFNRLGIVVILKVLKRIYAHF